MDFLLPVNQIRLIFFLAFSCAASVSDIRTGTILRAPLLFLIFLMIATSAYNAQCIAALCVSCFGSASSLLIFYTVRYLTLKRMGLADVWIAGAIGGLGGFEFFAQCIIVALILALPYVGQGNNKTHRSLPFIPVLTCASFLCATLRFFPAGMELFTYK